MPRPSGGADLVPIQGERTRKGDRLTQGEREWFGVYRSDLAACARAIGRPLNPCDVVIGCVLRNLGISPTVLQRANQMVTMRDRIRKHRYYRSI